MNEAILQILILGCVKGAIYSLIAIGFTLVFGVAGVVNLAHGTFYMLGAYFVYFFLEGVHLPIYLAICFSVFFVGCLGAGVDAALIRPMRQSGAYITIITLVFALLCQYILFSFMGARPRNIPYFFQGTVHIGKYPLAEQRLFIFISFILIITGLILFTKFTRFGKAMTAVSQSYTASILMGVSPERIFLFTSALSASMAGFAGIILSPLLNLNPTMWFFPLIKAFAIVILGGMGSITGSIVAAFILGFAETATTILFSVLMENIVSLLIIVTVLLIKPSGLFGAKSTA
jgi:branched-chain amino acid transport system permease protein